MRSETKPVLRRNMNEWHFRKLHLVDLAFASAPMDEAKHRKVVVLAPGMGRERPLALTTVFEQRAKRRDQKVSVFEFEQGW